MILDARKLEAEQVLRCDIAILGAGAAGLALALATARARRDLKVLVIEAGGRDLDVREQARYFAEDTISCDGHPPLELYRRRMFGGTTTIWGGRCIPLSPEDFSPRPEIGRTGWPIPYEEVGKYYPAALRLLEAGAFEFDAERALPGEPAPLASTKCPHGLVLNQLERFSRPTDLAQRYGKELDSAPNVQVLLNAPCVEILVSQSGRRATGLAIRTAEKEFTVEAGSTVIAAGGLETPRLLLWSQSKNAGEFGNGSGHLGRNYMAHFSGDLGQIQFCRPQNELRLDYTKSRDGVWCRRLIQLDANTLREQSLVNFVLRPTIPALHDPAHGNSILSAAFFATRFLIAEYARRLTMTPGSRAFGSGSPEWRHMLDHGRNILWGLPSLARFGAHWMRRRVAASRKLPSLFLTSQTGAYPLEFNIEQLPDKECGVRLGSNMDPNGVPRIALDWRLDRGLKDKVIRIFKQVGSACRSAGIGDVVLDEIEKEMVLERCRAQGGHHIGTARMSSDPRGGVVDQHLEVWDTKDLYILGPAVFPTCGFANPTLTIVALALRLAERLTVQKAR